VKGDHLTLVKLWHQELAIFSFSMLAAMLLKLTKQCADAIMARVNLLVSLFDSGHWPDHELSATIPSVHLWYAFIGLL
jgi:hypothetical protein